MIDINVIREHSEILEDSATRRGINIPILEASNLDRQRRSVIVELDDLRARRNDVSREIGHSKEKPVDLIDEMREVGGRIKKLEEEERNISIKLDSILLNIPNIPSDTVPVGDDEDSNVVIRVVGDKPEFNFEAKPHWEIGEDLGIIDIQSGVKLAQSRFYVLRGKGAALQRSLIQWMLNLHTSENGYDELYLPYMVNRETVTGSSHLPHFEENMYHDLEDDLFMVPTAEAPVTGMFRQEIIDYSQLPMRFVSHTPCWRREKFSAGRDTRGIKRVHQFDKVEMYKFVEPGVSYDELELLVGDAERVCEKLGIQHRVLELCTGDLGFAAAKSYDVEMWGAGTEEWLEVSSCSNCTDFQSRRASIRYRPDGGGRPRLLHTLNGSGLAIPRVMIAIMENFQQEDGSVVIPEVLQPYTGFAVIDKS
ncbi:serine--tRNA ligase [SAR202 cluster bacterium AC-647-P02_OGT_505m]|nr:serine--tRNA ligase [SAR202 cluster bacterium AC-647-P02_OGT_505m]